MTAAVALFFAAFAVPGMALALLAARDFALRGSDAERVTRARLLLAASGVCDALLAIAALGAAGVPPLANARAGALTAFGAAGVLLAAGGAVLFRAAARAPSPGRVRAAETVPFVLVVLDLSLLVAAAR